MENSKELTGLSMSSLLRVAEDRCRWAAITAEATVGGYLSTHRWTEKTTAGYGIEIIYDIKQNPWQQHQAKAINQHQDERNKKSLQIVGLRPPMCSQIFQPVNFNANQLSILVHLQLL